MIAWNFQRCHQVLVVITAGTTLKDSMEEAGGSKHNYKAKKLIARAYS
jgi:hypothetical protein